MVEYLTRLILKHSVSGGRGDIPPLGYADMNFVNSYNFVVSNLLVAKFSDSFCFFVSFDIT